MARRGSLGRERGWGATTSAEPGRDKGWGPEPGGERFGRSDLLKNFAVEHRTRFPMLVRVLDWDLPASSLDLHQVTLGTELVLHGWTRQSKLLATSAPPFHPPTTPPRYFAIPLTYQGTFRVHPSHPPRPSYRAPDLARLPRGHHVTVVTSDNAIDSRERLKPGDVIRVKSVRGYDVSAVVSCDRLDADGKLSPIEIPSGCTALFEDIQPVDDADTAGFIEQQPQGSLDEEALLTVRELVPYVGSRGGAPLVVEMVHPGGDHRGEPEGDLPLLAPLVLGDLIAESAVYASVLSPTAPAFHVPMRTLVYLRLVRELERDSSPLLTRQDPRLSTMDRCVEPLDSHQFGEIVQRASGAAPLPTGALGLAGTSSGRYRPKMLRALSDYQRADSKFDKALPSVAESEVASRSIWKRLGSRLSRTKSSENLQRSSNAKEPVTSSKPASHFNRRSFDEMRSRGGPTSSRVESYFDQRRSSKLHRINSESQLNDADASLSLTPNRKLFVKASEVGRASSVRMGHEYSVKVAGVTLGSSDDQEIGEVGGVAGLKGTKPRLFQSRSLRENVRVSRDLNNNAADDLNMVPQTRVETSYQNTKFDKKSTNFEKKPAIHESDQVSEFTNQEIDFVDQNEELNFDQRENKRNLNKNRTADTLRNDTLQSGVKSLSQSEVEVVPANNVRENKIQKHDSKNLMKKQSSQKDLKQSRPISVRQNKDTPRVNHSTEIAAQLNGTADNSDFINDRKIDLKMGETWMRQNSESQRISYRSPDRKDIYVSTGTLPPLKTALSMHNSGRSDAVQNDLHINPGGATDTPPADLHPPSRSSVTSPALRGQGGPSPGDQQTSQATDHTSLAGYHNLAGYQIPRGYALIALPAETNSEHLNTNGKAKIANDLCELDFDSSQVSNHDKVDGLSIPLDGNLSALSVRRFVEFLSLMKIEDKIIQYCIKVKVDGRRFAAMTPKELERCGLGHPIVAYFRRRTHVDKGNC